MLQLPVCREHQLFQAVARDRHFCAKMFTRGLAIACATATACSAVNAASFCDPSTDWTTEWADEFEGPEIDSEKWSVTVGVKPAAAASSVDRPQTRNAQTRGHGGAQESRDNSVPLLVGGNKNPGMDFAPEARHALGADCAGDSCVLLGSCRSAACTADNVYLENGTLVLRAQREQVQGLNYTTGAVNTRHKSTWTAAPGAFRMCISAKLPGSGPSGQGLWPAHWLMPNDDTCDPDEGEIDIMEMVDGTGTVYGTYHWQTSFPVANCSFPKNHSSVSGNVDLTGSLASRRTALSPFLHTRCSLHVFVVVSSALGLLPRRNGLGINFS